METTRSKIVDILRRRLEATIDELTHTLDLAPATVRRHLDILQRDGYVRARPVRRETGRPHYAFVLTQEGQDLLPQHFIRITIRLVEEIVALRPDETAGKSGRELAGLVFERVAEKLALSYQLEVRGRTLAQRLDQTVAALANEGLLFDVTREADAYVIAGHDCPCRRIADGDREICSHDQRLLVRLLDADVERAPTAEGCVYRIRPRREASRS